MHWVPHVPLGTWAFERSSNALSVVVNIESGLGIVKAGPMSPRGHGAPSVSATLDFGGFDCGCDCLYAIVDAQLQPRVRGATHGKRAASPGRRPGLDRNPPGLRWNRCRSRHSRQLEYRHRRRRRKLHRHDHAVLVVEQPKERVSAEGSRDFDPRARPMERLFQHEARRQLPDGGQAQGARVRASPRRSTAVATGQSLMRPGGSFKPMPIRGSVRPRCWPARANLR